MFQPPKKLLFIIASLLSALAGSFALMTAAKKVLHVSGSSLQNSIRLPLVRLGVSESKSFVDLVSGAVRNLHKATPANAHQAGRKAAETLKNSRNGDEVRTRASRVTQPPLNQSYQEPDAATSESLNGSDNRYRKSRLSQPSTPQPNQEPTETPNTPSSEGWYRTSSRDRRMYIE